MPDAPTGTRRGRWPGRPWAVAGRRLRALLPRRGDYDLRPRTVRADLVAGVTVGVVALPLALAFGESAGVGPAAGMVTAVVAGVVAAVFGGSGLQVSGPTGAMAVVLAPIVAAHGVGAVAVVSALAGLFVILAGVLRLGGLVSNLPWPVVEGFTVGIACVIGLQQVPAALGLAAEPGHGVLPTAWTALGRAFSGPDLAPLLWSVGTVAVVAVIMVGAPRLRPGLPGSLVAVVVVTVVAEVAHAPLRRIGVLPQGLPSPTLPTLDPAALSPLLGAALAVAALAAVESLLSARVAASMAGARGAYDPDRELVGQGLASVAGGLFGGMPATGAIARTAVNVRSGARTRLAAVVHAAVILGVVYLATGPVSRIPSAALAGVLLVTSVRMVSLPTVRAVLRSGPSAALSFGVTALLTVVLDLVQAIEIGLVVAAFLALRRLARDSGAHREAVPGPERPEDGEIAVFRLEGALFFGAAERICDGVLRRCVADRPQVVVLRMSGLSMVDASGGRALRELVLALDALGTTVLFKGLRPEHRGLLGRTGTLETVDGAHVVDDLGVAVDLARSHVRADRDS
ncbi:SulP family inorganic anion transporter [Pseudonocardia sp. WMMC193]|uniref:SulP family inorganic anion transporter n=1 Tax=Pseudonocardia sp. WMMC193 TaxID=2911965 RepID=UPI001F29130F|nr:SulP family inorganic anion transporter [Pseudonocardia sp. WMMC193]MCF7548347.1 SulP family inorganic anion transporter [Pseudonocardia sp. WMMC193]